MSAPRQLALAATLVLATHVAFLIVIAPVPLAADALEYHRLGGRMAEGFGYTLGGESITSLTPGYPIFIGAFYAVFGPHPWIIRIAQVFCLGSAVLVLFLTVQRLRGERPAWIAFMTIALLPAWFIYPGTLNAESLLLLVEVLFLAAALHQPQTSRWVAASGTICGLLTLIKPEFLVWLPLPTLVAERRRALPTLALSALCFAMVLAPWTIRNALTFHRFIPLSVKTGHSLWLSSHLPELKEFGGPEFNVALTRCLVPGDPKATDDCLLADAKHQIAQHPGYFITTGLRRVVRTLFGSHTEYLRGLTGSFAEALRARQIGVLVGKASLLVAHTVFVLGGLLGIALLCRDRQYWFLLYLLAAKLAVHAVLFGTPRYGLHLSPLFAIGCGALTRRGSEAKA